MTPDEIREIIRQELAAFFTSPVTRVAAGDALSPAEEMRIRSSARSALAEALAKKANRRAKHAAN